MHEITAHFIGGPLHGCDKRLDRAAETLDIPGFSRPQWVSDDHAPVDGYVKHRYRRIYQYVVSGTELMHVYEYDRTDSPAPSPQERIARAQRELEKALAVLDT